MPTGIPKNSKMYRTSFAVDARQVATVVDWLSIITSYNVEWEPESVGRYRVTFMHNAHSLPGVISFMHEDVRAYDLHGPTPAMEYDEEAAADITKIIDLAGRTTVTTQDLKEALVAAGRSPKSTPYLSKALRDKGLIKYEIGPTVGRYIVVRKSKAKPKAAKPAAKKKTAKKAAKKAKVQKSVSNGEKGNV